MYNKTLNIKYYTQNFNITSHIMKDIYYIVLYKDLFRQQKKIKSAFYSE